MRPRPHALWEKACSLRRGMGAARQLLALAPHALQHLLGLQVWKGGRVRAGPGGRGRAAARLTSRWTVDGGRGTGTGSDGGGQMEKLTGRGTELEPGEIHRERERGRDKERQPQKERMGGGERDEEEGGKGRLRGREMGAGSAEERPSYPTAWHRSSGMGARRGSGITSHATGLQGGAAWQ